MAPIQKREGFLGLEGLFVPPCLVPQGQFDTVPKAEFVVDHAEIVLHHVFGSTKRAGDFAVLTAFRYALNDVLFTLVWPAAICCLSNRSCLLYSIVASLTRLIPPLIPNRRKRRLK